MVYKFRQGYSTPVDAQTVGDRLESIRLERGGDLTPKDVVDDSRPDDAPLHPCFEWDDATAAESYREEQARRIIRSVEIIPDPEIRDEPSDVPAIPQIAYVSIGRPNAGPCYRATSQALSEEESRRIVLADAVTQLRGWRRRYSQLQELSRVFKAIDEIDRDDGLSIGD